MTVTWGFARSDEEAEAMRRRAQSLVGDHLARVRYFTFDYGREEYRPKLQGPFVVEAEIEWRQPHWRSSIGDDLEWGAELMMGSGRRYSVGWDTPGEQEGVGLREEPMTAHGVSASADCAVWDVTENSRWAPLVGERVTEVKLHFVPFDETRGSWSCSALQLRLSERQVTL